MAVVPDVIALKERRAVSPPSGENSEAPSRMSRHERGEIVVMTVNPPQVRKRESVGGGVAPPGRRHSGAAQKAAGAVAEPSPSKCRRPFSSVSDGLRTRSNARHVQGQKSAFLEVLACFCKVRRGSPPLLSLTLFSGPAAVAVSSPSLRAIALTVQVTTTAGA